MEIDGDMPERDVNEESRQSAAEKPEDASSNKLKRLTSAFDDAGYDPYNRPPKGPS